MSRNLTTRHTFTALALLILAGCVNQLTPAAWLGASFADLQNSFGDPEAVLINAQGNRVYVFRGRDEAKADGPTRLALGQDEVVMPDGGCAIMFELQGEVVTRWDWEGSNCNQSSVANPKQY